MSSALAEADLQPESISFLPVEDTNIQWDDLGLPITQSPGPHSH